jgi:hypothetical protein
MIKILMDECLPKKLKYRIEELEPDFFVKTTPDTEYREALWDGQVSQMKIYYHSLRNYHQS